MSKDPVKMIDELIEERGMYGQNRYSKQEVNAWVEKRANVPSETEEEKIEREEKEAKAFNKLLTVIGCVFVAAVIICIIQM